MPAELPGSVHCPRPGFFLDQLPYCGHTCGRINLLNEAPLKGLQLGEVAVKGRPGPLRQALSKAAQSSRERGKLDNPMDLNRSKEYHLKADQRQLDGAGRYLRYRRDNCLRNTIGREITRP